jgi:hypothetical protein
VSEPRLCPQCGAPLPADAPQGVCPKCLIDLGLAAANPTNPAGSIGETTPHSSAASGFVPPTPAELAASFPQLEILELLGQGGMGAVYKARQPRLDRLVALKILPPQAGQDPSFAERFTREARALARLSHPRIVAMHDFGDVVGMYYFIMEYVDGANLRQLIRSQGLLPEQALAIVPQICEALQYAHDEGVVHRDIKPENVLVDGRGRIKIADFGLAKLLGNSPADLKLTRTQQVMGTPHYMAPEQIEHPQQVDHRADIYSLGVVFYEMLTGELPIGRFGPPSEKVAVDVRLDDVVLRALQKDPERRYQHAGELKTDVDSIVDSGVPGAKRPAPLAATTPPATGEPAAAPDSDSRRAFRGPGKIPTAVEMMAMLACLIGGLATLMPWSYQHVFVVNATLSGFDTWHGLVTGGVFAAALLALIVAHAMSVNAAGRLLATTTAGVSAVVIAAIYLFWSQPTTLNVPNNQIPAIDDLFKPLTDSLTKSFAGTVNDGLQEGKLIGPYVVLTTGVILIAITARQVGQLLRFSTRAATELTG